jgi:hypothetical protein
VPWAEHAAVFAHQRLVVDVEGRGQHIPGGGGGAEGRPGKEGRQREVVWRWGTVAGGGVMWVLLLRVVHKCVGTDHGSGWGGWAPWAPNCLPVCWLMHQLLLWLLLLLAAVAARVLG